MKKLSLIFYLLIFSPITSYAETSDWKKCSTDISHDIMLKKISVNNDPEYKQIYEALKQEEKAKTEKYINNPYESDSRITCEINYNRHTFNCKAGQTPKDCITEEDCWPILSREKTSMFLELETKDRYIEQKCGPEPDSTTTSDTDEESDNTDTQKSKKQQRQEDKAAKKLEKQLDRDMKKAEKQMDKDIAKQQKQMDKNTADTKKEQDKKAECAKKNPPMDVKKNSLGMWVCTDTDATIADREQKKATNKDLKAFWDDIDDAEKAFNKRVKQLKKSRKASK